MHFKFEIWICNLPITLMNKFFFKKRGLSSYQEMLINLLFEVCFICITSIIMKIQHYASVYCIVLLCWTSKKVGNTSSKWIKMEYKIMIKDNFNSLLILP